MIRLLEFNEATHTYSIDGVVLPSVTQIISEIMPNKYANVNERVLSEKAKFGTTGHKIIEYTDVSDLETAKNYARGIKNKSLEICIREYLRLVSKYNINPHLHEMRVHYGYIYAGTLDMIASVNKEFSLIDIKFTSALDKEYLAWQLGMYSLALKKYLQFDKYYCLWLPKGDLGQLVEIQPKTTDEIISKLSELGYIKGCKLKW